MNLRLRPSIRISAAITLLMLGLLLVAAVLGVFPDPAEERLAARTQTRVGIVRLVEDYLRDGREDQIDSLLTHAILANNEILGIVVRNVAGQVTATAGNSEASDIDPAVVERVVSGLSIGGHPKGEIEVAFHTANSGVLAAFVRHPLTRLVLLLALPGFLLCEFYLRRLLSHSDPLSIMPERVRTLFDVLAEGVVIIDEKARIITANHAFARTVGIAVVDLEGRMLSDLPWGGAQTGESITRDPWLSVLKTAIAEEDAILTLTTEVRGLRYYSVNVTPIRSEHGRVRGALATFDDQTKIIETNDELRRALATLESQRREIEEHNEELKALATRDSLTGCLNRRAFLEIFEAELIAAQKRGYPLSCLMCDIDHFKSINDTYGHSTGDRVIQQMAKVLQAAVRENDHICRYGGEEFSVLLPGITMVEAAVVAERIRANIETQGAARLRLTGDRKITASFGVTELANGAVTLSELIDQADRALYWSKESGRNRVSVFTPIGGGGPEITEEKRVQRA